MKYRNLCAKDGKTELNNVPLGKVGEDDAYTLETFDVVITDIPGRVPEHTYYSIIWCDETSVSSCVARIN